MAIISNISVKLGAIIRGTAIIRGNTVLSVVAAVQPRNNFPCMYAKNILFI